MFAPGKQACSWLRVAGGRFSCPEFGNKAAQAQRGVVGAASGSASGLWGCGSCLSWNRWVWLWVVLSGLVESYRGGAPAPTPAQTSPRRLRGPARRLQVKQARRGLWPPVRRRRIKEGVGVAHSAATARPPGWRRRATRSLKAAPGGDTFGVTVLRRRERSGRLAGMLGNPDPNPATPSSAATGEGRTPAAFA
jgi:hypothetical protein